MNDYYLIEVLIYSLKTIGFLLFSTYLLILHTYLIITNKTTYEYQTLNRFVVNYHNLLFCKGQGQLLQRRFTRCYQGVWQKLIKPTRSQFLSFTSKVYNEIPSYIEQQRIKQKIQFINNDTIDKMQLNEKLKTYQSELCSVLQTRQMQTQQQIETSPQPQQEFHFRFFRVESDSNREQNNQFSNNSRDEKQDIKIQGLIKSQDIRQYNKSNDLQKEESIKFNNQQNDIQSNKFYNLG